MVISAEPPPSPLPDPVAEAAMAAAGTSSARLASFSSFPSLKTWGRGSHQAHHVLRCGYVSRDGGAIATARRPAEQLREVGEKLLRHEDEVEVAGIDAQAAKEEHAAEEEALAASLSKLRAPRRRRQRGATVLPASASPPIERRPPRAARGEPRRDRPRFSVTLTTEEIEEDIYAVTGARARRRPRRRPRAVQKQLDMLFPGLWLSEITAENYQVPDDR